jgi:hypothetical protein
VQNPISTIQAQPNGDTNAIDMTSTKPENNRRKSYYSTHGKNDTLTPQHLEDDPEDQGVQSK